MRKHFLFVWIGLMLLTNVKLMIFSFLFEKKKKIGLIVLLGSGVHTVWAFWELYASTSWLEVEVIMIVGSWYLSTIIGTAIAAVLIRTWSKKKLYVSSINAIKFNSNSIKFYFLIFLRFFRPSYFY